MNSVFLDAFPVVFLQNVGNRKLTTMVRIETKNLPKTTSVEDLIAIAKHADKLAKIIRNWLPVVGDSAEKTSGPKTAESWFSQAAKSYEDCELIRNPGYAPFVERGYSYFGFSDAAAGWQELCSALDELAVLYHWEGISDHSGAHGWNWWDDTPISSADPKTLDRIERAVSELNIVAGEIMDSSVPSPIESEKERTTERTETTETADTDDILENESEIVRHWTELCQKLKGHWFKAIEKAGKDIRRQTYFKQFFARQKLPGIWKDSGWSGMMKTFKENENEWLVEYEKLKTSLHKADT